jgi:hypothetical protein
MAAEPLHVFDPRRNMHVQGFSGRAATTTIHDASETGLSISGIFQAAEDFAVLCLYNAYDYYNHLRLKHLPRADLSDLKIEFDIEYDHDLDGAMRFDAAKYPSVSWDALTFVCGKGEMYQVRLLDHASVISGSETPATLTLQMTGGGPRFGTDYFHLHFRDTRYTVTTTDAQAETQLTGDIPAGEQWVAVGSTEGFAKGDWVYIEKTGTNQELVYLDDVVSGQLRMRVTMPHPADSYVTLSPGSRAILAKFAALINDQTESDLAGRYGPCQASIIEAVASTKTPTGPGDPVASWLTLTFKADAGYGKLGNLDRVMASSGHKELTPQEQFATPGYDSLYDVLSGHWFGDDGGMSDSAPVFARFRGGDNDKKYRISLDFTQELRDKQNRLVPMNDCRKIYMVFAPRFERVEEELEDGCFLTADAAPDATNLTVDNSAGLAAGGRYFIGDPAAEERLLLVSVDSPTQITVERAYQNSAPGAWPAGARIKKLSPVSGVQSDIEWRARISNIAVTGDASLKVGGGSERIEEADARCKFAGYWEDYAYDSGWPTQWWSGGHARRCAPSDACDMRTVSIRYSAREPHDLYLGTFLAPDCGRITVAVDGAAVPGSPFDLYLDEYGGTTANLKIASGVSAGNHTVEIAALFERNEASGGYYFYFDYLWPLVPQDVPDPPEEYPNVSLAIDFDTDHGYRKPPAWHLWHLQRLGFRGHADVYMGVFWNNKRQRVGASYPYATIEFSGGPVPGEVISVRISGTTINHAIGYGETLQQIVSHFRAAINGMFAGVWADNHFGNSTTLRIQSKAPLWTFFDNAATGSPSVSAVMDDHLGTPGAEGDWELIDAVSPVMTEGARRWIRDLAGQFQAAGIKASFAFSMEVYNPPPAMRAKYLSYAGGVVSPGADVYLEVPSYQMHFGPRVQEYLKQMYRECADEIAAAGLDIVLQFGETQWWYFDNRQQDPQGGMPFYDPDTIAGFAAAKGHQIWPFTANTDDPAGDPAYPYETADFLRDRIWQYCRAVIDYVRQKHPAAMFECLWPLDANQGRPSPDPAYRKLLMHVNLPNEWKNSSYGVKYFRSEGFDYDVWQKNANLSRQAMLFPAAALGRPAEECMYLSGIYGPPDPPMPQSYGAWRGEGLYSFCFWALDQFCLNSRPVPLEIARQVQGKATAAAYHKPRAARAAPLFRAEPVVATAAGALNRFQANTRVLNG